MYFIYVCQVPVLEDVVITMVIFPANAIAHVQYSTTVVVTFLHYVDRNKSFQDLIVDFIIHISQI